MATIIPVTGSLVVFRYSLAGDLEPMVTTLGLQEAAGFNGPLCVAQLLEATQTTGGIGVGAGIIAPYSFEGVTVYHQTASGFTVFEGNEPALGTAAGSAIPSNCAVLINKVTAQGGRRHRGRFYFPPVHVAESNVDARGQINSVSFLTSLFNEFYDRLIASSEIPPPVVFHSDGSAGTLITAFSPDSVIATQRKRMR